MSLEDDFQAARESVNGFSKRPTDGELLQLYGLFKQATTGDARGKRPGMLDFRGRAKFDAWASHQGESSEQCMQAYVELVRQLESRYR